LVITASKNGNGQFVELARFNQIWWAGVNDLAPERG